MGNVPVDAKQRLVGPARVAVLGLQATASLPCVLPVSSNGWRSIVDDCALDLDEPILDVEFGALLDAGTMSPQGLRSAACRLAEVVALATEQLWFVQAFAPAAPDRADALRYALIDAAVIGLDVAAGIADDGMLVEARAAVAAAAQHLGAVARTFEFPDDLCVAAFGVARDELLDERGVFAGPRLLAAYYGRYQQLAVRIGTLLSLLTARPPDIINALGPAEALVLSDRPLVTLRTAIRVRDLFQSKIAHDVDALARPLREMKLAVDRSVASHSTLIRLQGQRDATETRADRAYIALDFYRRMVEGQLRPWGWVLLQVFGRTAAKQPELSSLREQLVAEGHPLLLDAAAGILPQARNAAAHEDYEWDDEQAVLKIGGSTVDPDDLDDASGLAYAFMIGAESAWRCTRAASAEFAAGLDSQDPAGGFAAINVRAAVDHFGTNGLHVRRWTHDVGTLTVVLDAIPLQRINPCFQAVMCASRHLEGTGRFLVTTPHAKRVAMDLTRQSLDATFVVWSHAIRRFPAMPLSTFLPASAWTRLAVELPDEAAQASAWHALNDAVHAYNEAHDSVGSWEHRLSPLIDRLDLVTTALAATLTVLPDQSVGPLLQVIELTRPAAAAAMAYLRGFSSVDASRFEDQIRDLHASWPSAAVLPTVDPTPLDLMSG